ncbi:MAG: hypothetical protein AB8C95_06185 [Phycisphaeraceae bacterium]
MVKSRLVVLLSACLSLLLVLPAMAGPDESEFGDLAEALRKKVSVELIGTPLSRTLDTLSRDVGLNLVIHPSFKQDLSGNLINLTIKDLPASKALNLIGVASQTDWYIQEGIVMFATKRFVDAMRLKTEVYDIRALVESVPNFTGPDLSVDVTLSNTSSGGSDSRQSGSYGASGGGGGGGLFGDSGSDLDEDLASRQELVDQVTSLINVTTGEPDQWLDEEFMIDEFNGNLIVKTTPEVHAEIKKLLDVLSGTAGKMLMMEGQFYAVPRSLMDELDGKLILDAKGYKAFAKKLERGATPNAQRIAAARTVCFNSQRVYVYAAKDGTLLSDIEPEPNTAGVDPTLSTAHNGAVLDIKPTITLDGKSISVSIRSEVALNGKIANTKEIPVGYSRSNSSEISTTGSFNGEVKDSGEEGLSEAVSGSAKQSGKISGPTTSGLTGTVELDLPEQEIVTYRSNVRVPNGGAVVLSGVTDQFEAFDADGMEIIFVLRAKIAE